MMIRREEESETEEDERARIDEAIKMHSRAGLALMGIFWAAYLWSVYL